MKKLFISMLAVAALASCSQEDVIVADKGDLIGFNSFVENSTRADDPSYSANNIQSFKVWGTVNGVNIYDGALVSRNNKNYNVAWDCEGNQQYWISGADYVFTGIVDGDKANVSKTTAVNGLPTTIEYTADGATDLLCQTIVRKAYTGSDIVAFNFTHLLSKVNFTVNNNSTDAKDYIFVARDITFTGAKKGTYTIAYPTDNGQLVSGSWTVADADKGDKELSDLTVKTDVASAELDTEVLFIPGSYAVDFSVDVYYQQIADAKKVTTMEYTGSTQLLEANKAYNFVVNVSLGSSIQFTVEKQPTWNPAVGGTEVELK
ncbi:MAG: fimbrillin family protein [Alistipes sp.]|nr:fimbrillin family protein [Alistipes sp.]